MKTSVNTLPVTFSPVLFALAVITSLWVLFSYEGISSAISVWYISEIFQHCFFVIPGAIYLIWLERERLSKIPLSPSWLALPFILGQILLYVVGLAGDIQLFMHVATFTMLPTLIWFVIGDRAAYHIIFPLCFMFFSIPFGEELIPFLQEITADISVYFLQLTGVPLFRSGLYIEVPGGRFLVAEACSGVSFFIASVVIGNLYAYMNLVSTARRIGFVVLSIIYPIIANAIRVYGIILTGYLSDMEHAVGADHLIYGWFFFAIVIVSLVLLGELFRRGDKAPVRDNVTYAQTTPHFVRPVGIIIAIFIIAFIWRAQVQDRVSHPNTEVLVPPVASWFNHQPFAKTRWEPIFNDSRAQQVNYYRVDSLDIGIYQVSYDGINGELVSFQNKLYDQDRWTLVSANAQHFERFSVMHHRVSSVINEKKSIYFAYYFNGKYYRSKAKVKLAQTFAALLNRPTSMRLVAVSTQPNAENSGQQSAIEAIFSYHLRAMQNLEANDTSL